VRLAETVLAVCRATDASVERHVTAVRVIAGALAAELARRAVAGARTRLAHLHALSDGFVTVLAARADGRIVGASPLAAPPAAWSPRGSRWPTGPYFQVPMRTGGVFVSDAFLGGGAGRDPRVAVSAPVLARTAARSA
jgi:hypothetical protein